MPFKIDSSKQGDIVVLAPIGALALDGGNSFEFTKAVDNEINQGNKQIVIDLAGCSNVDSSGIASLVRVFTKTASAGAKVAIANPQPRVQEVFKMTRLETILKPYNSVQEAIAALHSNVA
jgi:anti-sigma B factor antagonist